MDEGNGIVGVRTERLPGSNRVVVTMYADKGKTRPLGAARMTAAEAFELAEALLRHGRAL